jgi:hypothetical protein
MRQLFFFCLILLAACTPTSSPSPTTAASLEIIAPENGSEFVSSDLWLEWSWQPLAAGQFYVLRLWYGDEAAQEVWTSENRVNVKAMIDTYSREIGTYHWQLAVVNTNAEGGFDSMASEWTAEQNLERVRRLSIQRLPIEQMSPTARFIAEQGLTSSRELFDFIRHWMYENTLLGEELLIYAPDYSDAAQQMYEHSLGNGELPQMYCNGISTTMLTVLWELGYESRLVFLYGEVEGWISQHTVLEIFNPDTQSWEVHDGTRDSYFIEKSSGERVAIDALVFAQLENYDACTGGACGYEAGMNHLIPRLGAFRYGYSSEVWVNPDRLNMSRRIEAFDNANFAEFIAEEAGVPVQTMIFHFDSWR